MMKSRRLRRQSPCCKSCAQQVLWLVLPSNQVELSRVGNWSQLESEWVALASQTSDSKSIDGTNQITLSHRYLPTQYELRTAIDNGQGTRRFKSMIGMLIFNKIMCTPSGLSVDSFLDRLASSTQINSGCSSWQLARQNWVSGRVDSTRWQH